MNLIEKYNEDIKDIELLTNYLEKNERILENYREEAEPYKKKVRELKRKYNIDEVKKEIEGFKKKLDKLKDSHLIRFAECICDAVRIIVCESLLFDLEQFLYNKGIRLNSDFKSLKNVKNDFYVDELAVYCYDSFESEHGEIFAMNKEFNVNELNEILEEVNLCISSERITRLIANYKNERYIFKRIPEVLAKYNIEYLIKDHYWGEVRIERENDMVVATTINHDEKRSLLKFNKDVKIKDLVNYIKNDIANLKQDIETSDEYKEFLRLKNLYD